jgi:hypothetical protein
MFALFCGIYIIADLCHVAIVGEKGEESPSQIPLTYTFIQSTIKFITQSTDVTIIVDVDIRMAV